MNSPFDKRAADALADEVAALVRRGVLDARSPAADALLDYRSPPSSPRADRLASLERERERLRALVAALRAVREVERRYRAGLDSHEWHGDDESAAELAMATEARDAARAALAALEGDDDD